eukprot:CAMPEP_0174277304 /NCGR_PEP_ID=MMETSP0439-20130205/60859_1 /TAXON_ID=0 /ORGANISM="Stereomyxa ramosa, Strain Chinc5" /LENGTH=362 /DNA_ID=CAMNT_0015369613 /DNA_START=11 /DNA_END=1096 /DNA_ORIENTATION=+
MAWIKPETIDYAQPRSGIGLAQRTIIQDEKSSLVLTGSVGGNTEKDNKSEEGGEECERAKESQKEEGGRDSSFIDHKFREGRSNSKGTKFLLGSRKVNPHLLSGGAGDANDMSSLNKNGTDGGAANDRAESSAPGGDKKKDKSFFEQKKEAKGRKTPRTNKKGPTQKKEGSDPSKSQKKKKESKELAKSYKTEGVDNLKKCSECPSNQDMYHDNHKDLHGNHVAPSGPSARKGSSGEKVASELSSSGNPNNPDSALGTDCPNDNEVGNGGDSAKPDSGDHNGQDDTETGDSYDGPKNLEDGSPINALKKTANKLVPRLAKDSKSISKTVKSRTIKRIENPLSFRKVTRRQTKEDKIIPSPIW